MDTLERVDALEKNIGASFKSIPNLFSFLPVVIFSWVLASTSGFTLRPIVATFPRDFAISLIFINSASDSTFIWNISLFNASTISSVVFPTPEKTIFLGSTPAIRHLLNSPSETTSAPAPSFASVLIMLKLELALTAK